MWSMVMSELDPLPALRGLIDEPIAPRTAFADELRARLLAELGSHRPAAIDEERTMEITTPGLQLVLPGDRVRQLPGWRRLAEIAALVALMAGVIAIFASERVGSPTNPPPTSQGNLGIYPQSFATPEPDGSTEGALLWEIQTDTSKMPLVDVVVYGGVTYFLEQIGNLHAVDSVTGELLWTANVGGNWGVAVDDSGVYVTANSMSSDSSTRLVKLDLATGNELWRTKLGNVVSSKPLLNNGIAYAWDAVDDLYAIDTDSGTELWHLATGDPTALPLDLPQSMQNGLYAPKAELDGDSIYVVTSDGLFSRITLANAESGEWSWQIQLDGDTPLEYQIAFVGDAVGIVSAPIDSPQQPDSDIATWNGQLTVVDRESGSELWQDTAVDYVSLLVSTDSQFFVTTSEFPAVSTPEAGSFSPYSVETTALDALSGHVDWVSTDFSVRGASSDGALLFGYTGTDAEVAVVDAASGNRVGTLASTLSIYPPYGFTDDTLFGYREDGALVAIDLSGFSGDTSDNPDSALLWQAKPEGDVRSVGSEAISNGTVFRIITTSDFQGVEAYDSVSGTLLWRHAVQGTELVADDSGVYVILGYYANPEMTISLTPESYVIGPNDASVVALDPQTGDELWSANTGTGESSPVLIDSTLYLLESPHIWNVARGTTQEATAIDTATGSILWNETVGAPMAQNIVSSTDRMVATDSNLVALLGNGLMLGVDRDNGAVLWQRPAFNTLNVSTNSDSSGDTLVLSVYSVTASLNYWLPDFPELQSQSAVIAYDASDGTPLWAYDTGGVVSNVTIADGSVVVLAGPSAVPNLPTQATPEGVESELDWVLIGIDLSSGEFAWEGTSGTGGTYPPPYIVAQSPGSDAIYVISRTMRGTLDVVDPTTGLSASSGLDFDQPIAGVPVNDGTHVFIQLKDGTLVATLLPVPLATQSGGYFTEEIPVVMGATPEADATPDAIAWRIDGAGSEVSGGDITVTGNVLLRAITTDAGGQIDAFDTETGDPIWSKPVWWTGGIVLGDDLIYLPVIAENGIDGSIVAMKPATGEIVWEQQLDGRPIMPSLLGTTLFAASDSGLMTELDARTGEVFWTNHASIDPANGYAAGPLPKVVGVSPKYVVALYPTGDRHNQGVLAVFDTTDGKLLYQLTDYPFSSTQYEVVDDTLVILSPPRNDSESDVNGPSVLQGIDPANGDIIWENRIVTRFDEPMIVTVSSEGNFIQVLGEQIETENGLYNTNGFAPGESLLRETGYDYKLGLAFQIDPATGEATYVSINSQYPYKYTGPLRLPGSIAIDFSQPPVSIDQPLLAVPKGDQQYLYLLLADGSIVAVKQEAIRPG
jgi:outer membrane protein assembly factor BamB